MNKSFSISPFLLKPTRARLTATRWPRSFHAVGQVKASSRAGQLTSATWVGQGAGRLSTLRIPPGRLLQCRHASSDAADSTIKRTGLYDIHIQHGGKMVPFGGFSMPVQYSDLSVGESHVWTREKASLFDVGHMYVLSIPPPFEALFNYMLLTHPLSGYSIASRAQQPHCCLRRLPHHLSTPCPITTPPCHVSYIRALAA